MIRIPSLHSPRLCRCMRSFLTLLALATSPTPQPKTTQIKHFQALSKSFRSRAQSGGSLEECLDSYLKGPGVC